MTKMEKNNLYDRICITLTEYEEGMNGISDVLEMLYQVVNQWEEITSEDDD